VFPETVAFATGTVTETDGGVVSIGGDWVVTVTPSDWADSLPAASSALTRYA
jgi:hypothetical protein